MSHRKSDLGILYPIAWLNPSTRPKQEAKLTSTLAQKVTIAKSIPEATAACQEWVSQQIELFSSQARKTIDATQDFTKACSQIVSDGKRD